MAVRKICKYCLKPPDRSFLYRFTVSSGSSIATKNGPVAMESVDSSKIVIIENGEILELDEQRAQVVIVSLSAGLLSTEQWVKSKT